MSRNHYFYLWVGFFYLFHGGRPGSYIRIAEVAFACVHSFYQATAKQHIIFWKIAHYIVSGMSFAEKYCRNVGIAEVQEQGIIETIFGHCHLVFFGIFDGFAVGIRRNMSVIKGLKATKAIVMEMRGNDGLDAAVQFFLYPFYEGGRTFVVGGRIKNNSFIRAAHNKAVAGNIAEFIGLFVRGMYKRVLSDLRDDQVFGFIHFFGFEGFFLLRTAV